MGSWGHTTQGPAQHFAAMLLEEFILRLIHDRRSDLDVVASREQGIAAHPEKHLLPDIAIFSQRPFCHRDYRAALSVSTLCF